MGMRVLLIEDDTATAQSIELMLKSESFQACSLSAIEVARKPRDAFPLK